MQHEMIWGGVEEVMERKYTKINTKLDKLIQQHSYSEKKEETRPQYNFQLTYTSMVCQRINRGSSILVETHLFH